MLTELPTALEHCSSFLRSRKGRRPLPLSASDYETIMESVTDSFFVVACYLSFFKLSPEVLARINRTSECCPPRELSLIKRAFRRDKTAFVEALESYLIKTKNKNFNDNSSFDVDSFETLCQLVFMETHLNKDTVDAFFKHEYKNPKNKLAMVKVLLLSFELNFKFVETVSGFSSYDEFLVFLKTHIKNLNSTKMESTSDNLKFFYESNGEAACFILKNGLFPTDFLTSLKIHPLDLNFASNPRLGRTTCKKEIPISLANPVLRLEDLLTYLETTEEENIDFETLQYRTILDWHRLTVESSHLHRIQNLLNKIKSSNFLTFLIKCTHGEELYLQWVISQAKQHINKIKQDENLSSRDFLEFMGLNKFSFLKRNIGEILTTKFYKLTLELFPQDQKSISEDIFEFAPLSVPDELKLGALEHCRAKALKSKEKLDKLSPGERITSENKKTIEDFHKRERTFNLARQRALTSSISRTRTAAAMRGGLK